MGITKVIENISTHISKNWTKDPAKALLNLGAVGLALSCIAQLFMIKTNKDIDKEKKKFLIPQELTDGIVNVGLTYTISKSIKDMAANLLEKGHFSTPKLFKFINKFNTEVTTFHQYINGMAEKAVGDGIVQSNKYAGETTTSLAAILQMLKDVNYENIEIKGEPYKGLIKDSFELFNTQAKNDELVNTIKTLQDDFSKFKNVVGIFAAIGGSVLASSIIVPFVRNKVAAKFQQKTLAKEKKLKPQMQYIPIKLIPPSSPFSVFNKTKI